MSEDYEPGQSRSNGWQEDWSKTRPLQVNVKCEGDLAVDNLKC